MIDTADLLQRWRHAADAARRALLWWGEELWYLLPRRVRQALETDPMAPGIIRPGAGHASETVAVQTFRSGRPEQHLPMDDWRAALAWVAERRRRWGPLMRVDLVLPADACLIRQREVPAVAGNRIAEVLALELERTTPFSAQDVRQGWRPATGPASGASLLVDRKSV